MGSDIATWLRLLELSGAGGVLVLGFIFLFRWLLPRIISSFEDGMASIATEMQKTNTTLKELHKCQKEMTSKLSSVVHQEVQHAYERLDDRVDDGSKDILAAIARMSDKLSVTSTKIDGLLKQLGS